MTNATAPPTRPTKPAPAHTVVSVRGSAIQSTIPATPPPAGHPVLFASGEMVGGKYKIVEQIGVGGMAVVFRATHQSLGRDVAVKTLLPELQTNRDVANRFEREARCLARLDHPHCLQVFDVGTSERGTQYMVVQLLEGQELDALLGAPFDLQRAIRLSLQVLRGLAHAHEHGVLHRDLKPSNIVVSASGDSESITIVDFGIAKIIGNEGNLTASRQDAQMTKLGLVFGTPRYMSPEQAIGMAVDGRTDIFSAGLLIFEMLTGVAAFPGEDAMALLRQRVSTPAPPLPDSIPKPLRDVISKMLALRIDQRYQDVTDALRDLEFAWANVQGRTTNAPGPQQDRTTPYPGTQHRGSADVGLDTATEMAYADVLDRVIESPSQVDQVLSISTTQQREIPTLQRRLPAEDPALELDWPQDQSLEAPRRKSSHITAAILIAIGVTLAAGWYFGKDDPMVNKLKHMQDSLHKPARNDRPL